MMHLHSKLEDVKCVLEKWGRAKILSNCPAFPRALGLCLKVLFILVLSLDRGRAAASDGAHTSQSSLTQHECSPDITKTRPIGCTCQDTCIPVRPFLFEKITAKLHRTFGIFITPDFHEGF